MTKRYAELPTISLKDLVSSPREELESRSRALTAVYSLSNEIAVCRVLGRYKMFVATADVGFSPHLILEGFWESWLTLFMARRVKPGMNVVDAGANHGYYSLLFADLVGPTGRVAAIEPNPPIASLLRRNLILNGLSVTTTVLEYALSARDDEQLVFQAATDEPKNGRLVDTSESRTDGTIQVKGAKLSTLLAEWNRIDFIKVDIEGAEEDMIKGASSILERDRPSMVLEFNALRCKNPRGFLGYLSDLYTGVPRLIGSNSQLHPTSIESLLDTSDHEDRLLFLEA